MLNILLIIILSPVAIICGIVSIGTIYGILECIIELIFKTANTISDIINERSNK